MAVWKMTTEPLGNSTLHIVNPWCMKIIVIKSCNGGDCLNDKPPKDSNYYEKQIIVI